MFFVAIDEWLASIRVVHVFDNLVLQVGECREYSSVASIVEVVGEEQLLCLASLYRICAFTRRAPVLRVELPLAPHHLKQLRVIRSVKLTAPVRFDKPQQWICTSRCIITAPLQMKLHVETRS